MSEKVLYRKYRSRALSEVVGQKHITQTLGAAIKNDRIAHAYLFVGPRGVGKTSVARILAFEVNNMKYSDSGHIDIIEIDAASNRRIDEIRELRDKIHIAPVEGKYKVYIIDEVHMLTREAFNALLKTLEEPPAHAIFVLATTEAHKIPETIVSRTQRYVFRPIDNYSQIQHLKNIADKEKLEVSDRALELIAEYADGSFRDSISLLDQLSSHSSQIDEDSVERFLGFSNSENIELIIDCIESGNIRGMSDQLDSLLRQGSQPYIIATQIIDTLRQRPLDELHINLIDRLLAVPASPKPHISLEIELVRAALQNSDKTLKATESNTEKEMSNRESAATNITTVAEDESDIKDVAGEKEISTKTDESYGSGELRPMLSTDWQEILTKVKQDSHPLYTVLRLAEVHTSDKSMLLKFQFAFHANRLNNKQLLARLREISADIREHTPEITVEVDKDARPTVVDSIEDELIDSTGENQPQDMQVIFETFGGGEEVEL